MEKNNLIQIRCNKCNLRLMDYMVQGSDDVIVMQGIVMKCDRCKRVMMFKKYTEGMLKIKSKNGVLKV